MWPDISTRRNVVAWAFIY